MSVLPEPIQSYVFLAISLVVAFAFVKVGLRLVSRVTKNLQKRGISEGLVEFAGAIVRVLIWLVAVSLILIEVMVTFGLRELLLESFSSFLTSNGGRIGVMVVIAIGGYVASRVLGILFLEYKRRSKLHPLTIDLFQNIARYLIYAIVAVLLLTNILVMAGLQTLAGTLVTLFTVFIGLVVSFAATGSIGNALSGVVIMSWRPYKEGDRVEIGEGVYGDVTEVDIMFTKIKTIKDEIIHVPNSHVLNNKIVNYSELGQVIVHYQVTIGYDAPRRLVERLLLQAVTLTEGLLKEPTPFVLVRDLNNNYVSYEVNAYTDRPSRMVPIYSDLMKNALDVFGDAGVEILSPQHVAVRKSEPTVKGKRVRVKSRGSRSNV